MVLRKIMGLFVVVLVISSAALATAGIPDPTETLAEMAGTNDAVVLFNLPNGGGSDFANAQTFGSDGTVPVDAGITMIVRDAYGVVIADFPSEDMWLESADAGMVACVNGAAADQTTNAAGETMWADPLNAGGYSEDNTIVVINGTALNQGSFALKYTSADINGDGIVNVADVALFSSAYYGAYDFSADFFHDGIVNVADVARLAGGLGATCP